MRCPGRRARVSKEAHEHDKRGLFTRQKRPNYTAKEAHEHGKKDLFTRQKRPSLEQHALPGPWVPGKKRKKEKKKKRKKETCVRATRFAGAVRPRKKKIKKKEKKKQRPVLE